jgi:coenzyme F420-reducing hydrogenase alpha subunit
MIRGAAIVPPTSQNLPVIEADLHDVISANMSLDDGALTTLCERTVRNYDPCISCSAHFLDLTVVRR